MDGWHRIGLDDDFPIRQAFLVGVQFFSLGSVFIENKDRK